MNVVPISRKPWPEMVKYLEEKLERAKRGEIRGLIVISEYDDGDSGYYVFHDENSRPVKLLGQLALATHGVCEKEDKRRADER